MTAFGSLKIPVMDIYAGGHSKARNPNMQAMFRMIGFGDNIGSGFPTILEAWKKENWRQPYLIERSDLHLVELSLSMVSLISEDCRDALHGIFGNNYHDLNKEEQFVLAMAATEKSISNYRVQQLLGRNPLEAGKILYSLVSKNMLVSTNKGRWTSYSINADYSQGVESRSKSQGVESRSKSQGVESRSKSQGVESRSKSQGVKSREQKKQEIIDS